MLSDAQQGQLSQQLVEQASYQWGQKISAGEVNSWLRSLPQLLSDLVDAGLGEVEVLLEHRLPHSPKRVDVILCGVHPRTGMANYVLIELKQWSKAELIAADLVSVAKYTEPVLHPVEQVRAYCQYLVDATPALAERPGSVFGIAYLHNARATDISSLLKRPADDFGQLFTMDDRAAMVDRLRVLLDEQRIAFQIVMRAVADALAARTQTVVVVLGGPGSGRSVIALSLLGELARKGRTVHHATGSKALPKPCGAWRVPATSESRTCSSTSTTTSARSHATSM
ncbi:hypothetical protein ACFRAQ_36520 [Nocardia sp. NPDC056611]|uniref:hypothetical protein n=1 Tax=Nocardia sp. NPDC056611 TaxID=3345877 RepID=UPI00366E1E0B